jgi:hypothetical protein
LSYKLPAKFEATFRDGPYLHRNPNIGNRIADFLYEDLVDIAPGSSLARRAAAGERVLNPAITIPGVAARRGDGSFGIPVPNVPISYEPGFAVARSATATVEIGVEVKIVAKAMGKQANRVIGDLRGQVEAFRARGGAALTVGIVGVNFSDVYTSYEGARTYPVGPGAGSPSREAPTTDRRLATEVAPYYDEFILLGFKATNVPPYPFAWVAGERKEIEYAALLARLIDKYERTF